MYEQLLLDVTDLILRAARRYQVWNRAGDVNDAAQDLSEWVLKHAPDVANASPPLRRKMIYDAAMDRFRTLKRKGARECPNEEWFSELENVDAQPAATPEQELLSRETIRSVREALRCLPANQRVAFVNRIKEIPTAQTAAVLGVTEGRVRQLYLKAACHLRHVLSGDNRGSIELSEEPEP